MNNQQIDGVLQAQRLLLTLGALNRGWQPTVGEIAERFNVSRSRRTAQRDVKLLKNLCCGDGSYKRMGFIIHPVWEGHSKRYVLVTLQQNITEG